VRTDFPNICPCCVYRFSGCDIYIALKVRAVQKQPTSGQLSGSAFFAPSFSSRSTLCRHELAKSAGLNLQSQNYQYTALFASSSLMMFLSCLDYNQIPLHAYRRYHDVQVHVAVIQRSACQLAPSPSTTAVASPRYFCVSHPDLHCVFSTERELHGQISEGIQCVMHDKTNTDQSTSMPIERPSPFMSALLLFAGTFIFSSAPMVSSIAVGSSSLTDTDFAANFFVLCARCFSRATDILESYKSARETNTWARNVGTFVSRMRALSAV
jgi:hypothetical protein